MFFGCLAPNKVNQCPFRLLTCDWRHIETIELLKLDLYNKYFRQSYLLLVT